MNEVSEPELPCVYDQSAPALDRPEEQLYENWLTRHCVAPNTITQSPGPLFGSAGLYMWRQP